MKTRSPNHEVQTAFATAKYSGLVAAARSHHTASTMATIRALPVMRVSNELTEVTTVYIDVPCGLPEGLEVFDMTDFVRSRSWVPVAWKRHLEMFPGQGQIMLVAPRDVCERLRTQVGDQDAGCPLQGREILPSE